MTQKTNPVVEELLAVEQCDREAAADLLDELSNLLDHNGIGQVADLIRDSEFDEHEAVAAFARHRQAFALSERNAERALDEWTVDELREAVRASVNVPGCSHNVFAREKGISSAKLSEFLSGKRGAEPFIVEPLGFRWVLVNANDYPRPEDQDLATAIRGSNPNGE